MIGGRWVRRGQFTDQNVTDPAYPRSPDQLVHGARTRRSLVVWWGLVSACHADPAVPVGVAHVVQRQTPTPSAATVGGPGSTGASEERAALGEGRGTVPWSDSNPGLAREQAALAERYAGHPVLAVLHGTASWYSDALAGRATASGERYDPRAFTAAHRTLPFGTVIRVRTVHQPRWAYVRVNDRGPFGRRERILDLSRAAASQLGLERAGVLPVRVEVLVYGPGRVRSRHLRRTR